MKTVDYCVCCNSTQLDKKLGYFEPFITHRVLDIAPQGITMNGSQQMFPMLFTNAIRCKQCEFVFSQVRFESEEMGRIYRNYRNDEYTQTRSIFEPSYASVNPHLGKHPGEIKARKERLLAVLKDLVDPASVQSVLDYGGDEGQHIPEIFAHSKKYLYEVSGAKPLPGIEAISDLRTLPPIDFIIISNVLEHIPFPAEILADIKRLCHANTYVFIDVPDELTNNPYPGAFHEHINKFSLPAVKALLQSNGFTVLHSALYDMNYEYAQGRALYTIAKPSWC